jgi:DNA helicase-2/ATP-dependent DNA helicase PcrA
LAKPDEEAGGQGAEAFAEGLAEALNPEQRRAMLATEGAVRVIAGPGTGKTRTLTARFCYLADTLGVASQNILCATFTNRAAGEMKSRIRGVLGDLDLGLICTSTPSVCGC